MKNTCIYKFVSDSGEITRICAFSRSEAVKLYCKEKGVNTEYVKKHCVIRNVFEKGE